MFLFILVLILVMVIISKRGGWWIPQTNWNIPHRWRRRHLSVTSTRSTLGKHSHHTHLKYECDVICWELKLVLPFSKILLSRKRWLRLWFLGCSWGRGMWEESHQTKDWTWGNGWCCLHQLISMSLGMLFYFLLLSFFTIRVSFQNFLLYSLQGSVLNLNQYTLCTHNYTVSFFTCYSFIIGYGLKKTSYISKE